MAELALSLALSAGQKLALMVAQNIQEEATLLQEFDANLSSLISHLKDLQQFLNYAESDEAVNQPEFIQTWIMDLRDVALDAEDIVEICAVVLGEEPQEEAPEAAAEGNSLVLHSSPLWCFSFLFNRSFSEYWEAIKKYKFWIISLFRRETNFKRDLCVEIKQLVRQFEALLGKANEKNMKKGVVGPVAPLGVDSQGSFPGSSCVIDDEDKGVDIEPKVLKVTDLVQRNRVTAIVGLGGSGKTRLLQHVYKAIAFNYGKAIWLCVSRTEIKKLQRNVLENLDVKYGVGEDEGSLKARINKELQDEYCFVVLDDIRELTEAERSRYMDVSSKLKEIGLPEHERCRVLISTRNQQVVKDMGVENEFYRMELLPKKSRKGLFLKHLGKRAQIIADANDAAVEEALQRCGGMPMAVIAMARLLNQQQDHRSWDSTLHKLVSSPCDTLQDAVTNTIKLSYDALDNISKQCFAFMGILQHQQQQEDDEIIEAEQLLGMWKAEGLVETHEDGQAVLKQLCDRYLIAVEEHESKPAVYVVAKMQNLVQEVAQSVYIQYGGTRYSDRYLSSSSSNSQAHPRPRPQQQSPRRICMLTVPRHRPVSCPSSVRSLLAAKDLSIPQNFLDKARALRVLRLWNKDALAVESILTSAQAAASLKLLRFLDISHTDKLPECVRYLTSLEYLYTKVRQIPSWITDLQRLTHFSANLAIWRQLNKPMPNLQVVKNIFIEISNHSNGGSSGNRSNDGGGEEQEWTWDLICEKHKQLQQVNLSFHNLEAERTPPDPLRVLLLDAKSGSVTTLPERWILALQKRLESLSLWKVEFPADHVIALGFHSLRVLSIRKVECTEYPAVISSLPELRHLILHDNHKCQKLPQEFGSSEAFRSLRSLTLEHLSELSELPALDEHAMPHLLKLQIIRCPKIVKAPGWNKRVPNLEKLKTYGSQSVLEVFGIHDAAAV